MDSLFSIQAEVTKIESKPHGSVKVTFSSQEGLTPEQRARVMKWHNELLGHLVFVQEEAVDPEKLLELPKLVTTKGEKSKSTLLREAIWRLGYRSGLETKEEQDNFYQDSMDKLINYIDAK